MQRLFLSRQDRNIEKNKENGDERLPYFKLSMPPEQDGGEWKEVAALWKSKSGVGYNAKLAEGVTIIFDRPMPLSPSPLKNKPIEQD